MNKKILEFEEPLNQLNEKIEELKNISGDVEVNIEKEIQKIEKRATKLQEDIFSNLTPHQIVQIARHQNRPDALSLINLICDKFIPLKGDRLFKDDPSIIGGIAILKKKRVVFIAHQKGHDTKENIYRNFGMPHPEGYRKALRLMKLAEKFNLPIVTFIDTPGAFPGLDAEERGQSEAIATNLKEMSSLKVPIVSIVIGEGGSGGALAIGVANKLFMLEYSVYSVISPEGCASILFRDAKKSEKASEILKITASDVKKLGIADGIIPEPNGGAHNNWEEVSTNIKKVLIKELSALIQLPVEEIIESRYKKFRNIGQFTE
tara:strand:- start:46 stop:1002 length:957 start_codon:yes stop_codon:yes gene_type:complete